MNYTYFKVDPNALFSEFKEMSISLNEIKKEDVEYPRYVRVFRTGVLVACLTNFEDVEDWKEAIQITKERAATWKPDKIEEINSLTNATISASEAKKQDAIKPSHYKNFVDDYQWLDVMSRIPRYENPENFKAAVELQIRKYLDRNGRKDEELQELLKGLFYYIYLVKYIKNNNKPILAETVHKIMEQIKSEEN